MAGAAFLIALLAPGAASAATAYVVTDLNMRAGPSTGYPVVATLGGGATIEVYGCLSDYSWCDCAIGHSRGWVSGRYLEYIYEERRVLIPAYGPVIGLPIISFSFGNYWDRYYVDRPFYRERDRYRGHREVRRERRDRREVHRERRRDDRQEVRRERRRDDRQEARRERRRDDRQEVRRERREDRQDRRRCRREGGSAEECRQ